MNHTDWKQLEPWQDTQVISEDGRIPICFGLAATLYFHEGHSEDKRHAALDCFNEFDELCGSSLRWHRVSAETSRFNSVKKLRSRDMSPYLLSRKWDSPEAYDHAWSFYWHGGRNKDDASDVRIHAYGSPKCTRK